MAAVEESLLASGRVPANAGHSIHKGTPREKFVQDFLQGHISERVAIGSGEIIDHRSRPGELRPQMDVVLYERSYPRLDFGGNVNGFLVESVIATIEVKSTLTYDELERAVAASAKVKRLEPRHTGGMYGLGGGWNPPGILSFVVAYDGPAKMMTTHKWLRKATQKLGIEYPILPPSSDERTAIASPALDAIFVLGKGFNYLDTFPLGFISDTDRAEHPDCRWFVADSARGSLLLLFLLLTAAVAGRMHALVDPAPYVHGFGGSKAHFEP